ncbi:unnamed protein product [Ixodes pacificus]
MSSFQEAQSCPSSLQVLPVRQALPGHGHHLGLRVHPLDHGLPQALRPGGHAQLPAWPLPLLHLHLQAQAAQPNAQPALLLRKAQGREHHGQKVLLHHTHVHLELHTQRRALAGLLRSSVRSNSGTVFDVTRDRKHRRSRRTIHNTCTSACVCKGHQ